MPKYRSVSLPESLANLAEEWIEDNKEGYRNLAEVVIAATRDFLERKRTSPSPSRVIRQATGEDFEDAHREGSEGVAEAEARRNAQRLRRK